MKFSATNFRRFPLAIGAGLLLAAAFPQFNLAGLAWIAPGVLLLAAWGGSGAERFRLGYVAGLAHYLASLYWLLLIPYRWHSLPLGPAFGWLALSAYLAVFPAVWVWLVGKVLGEWRPTPNLQHPWAALAEIAAWSWGRRLGGALFGAVSWVALEVLRGWLLGGFPWNLLGASQYRMLPLIQLASVTGVFGLSLLVAWTSLSLLNAAAVIVQRPQVRSVWLGEVILPMVAVALTFAFGWHQLSRTTPTTRSLRVTLVQPSIPQTLIWNGSKDQERFRELLRRSEQALTNATDLLVWPEAAIPKLLRYDPEIREGVTQLARAHHVWMIVGSDDVEPDPDSGPRATRYFNCAFLISPAGEIVERYGKRHLVIFGEYIPFVRWLPFLKWFTPIDGGFTAGTEATRFELMDLKVSLAPLICYEDVFPQLARAGAVGDTDLLVNLTNDGWFGEGAAQWQQAAGAAFRAVENGLPLVRCANTGLSCWMDAGGGIREIVTDDAGGVYGAGFRTVTIPLVDQRAPTFYQQHGDWLGWGCVGLTVLVLGRRWLGRKAA